MYTNVIRKVKNIPAKIAVKKGPCAFCCRELDDETVFGKLYEIGDIYCHYFCVLLSCCLIQKGKDEDGLFGFLYPDILAEIARSKKHKCSYCGREGASLGCSVSQCKKQFHLPCGRERNAVSMFYGNYKTFCQKHAPKQNISDTIMAKVKSRMAKKRLQNLKRINKSAKQVVNNDEGVEELLCVICCEAVDGCPTINTFWPPCCGRDAWFHRSCLERMALSAGVHYLKCPLCNDKDSFHEAVLQQGYYVPDRDAAWELEQNAFSEIYERSFSCGLPRCLCPDGRRHDADTGPWDINVCVLCGSAGAHARCRTGAEPRAEGAEPTAEGAELQSEEADSRAADGPEPYVCASCAPTAATAPNLIQALHELALKEQQQAAESERVVRPLMPCRMSLRRTKRRADLPTSSRVIKTEMKQEVTNTELSRLELNLKTPKRSVPEDELRSPIQLLQERLCERGCDLNVDSELVRKLREQLGKPKPLGIKRKIVNNILEELANTIYKDKFKTKEPLREWNSPKKCADIKQEYNEESPIKYMKNEEKSNIAETCEQVSSDATKPKTIKIENDSTMEISNGNNMVNIDLVTIEDTRDKLTRSPGVGKPLVLKFSPSSNNKLTKTNIDMESFKTQYLNEVFCLNVEHSTMNDSEQRKEDIDIKMTDPDKQDTWKRKRQKRNTVKKIKIKLNKRKVKILKKEKKREKMKKKFERPRVLKQYVLKYDRENDVNHIARPSKNVTMKRKYVRKEKIVDHLKQTSLDNFFLTFK